MWERRVSMPINQNIENVIASALALPADERLAVIGAIHVSLADPTIDHGPEEAAIACRGIVVTCVQ
jgi:hypothetical protein